LDGATITMGDVSGNKAIIGYNRDSYEPGSVTDPLTDPRAYDVSKTFLTLYNKALKSGVLNDPNVKKVVESLATQVAYLGEPTTDIAGQVIESKASPGSVKDQVNSNAGHMNSAGICIEGKGMDDGVQCSGSA
jgi:hypothetical protein